MTQIAKHRIYVEVSRKRVFAGSVEWPGWTRSGRDEDTAVDALFAYASRYATALRGTRLDFAPPSNSSALTIVDHVLGADEGYLSRLGAKAPKTAQAERASALRATILDTLEQVARDGVPEGPRGGKRWAPRYFVRRSAWHVLDHAWEIEDRTPSR